MDLRFTEEQEMLRRAARDFLSAECPKAEVKKLEEDEKGYSPEVWKKMAELGWMGLVIPEEYGGTGMGFQDLMVLLEEMGRNILPGPYLTTMASTFPILTAGNEEQKGAFLPKIAQGELILTPALLEVNGVPAASGINSRAMLEGNAFIINGTKLFAEMAHVADYLICAARTSDKAPPEESITLFIVDAKSPGIYCEVMPTMGMDKLCEVRIEDVPVPQKNILGDLNKGWPIVEEMLKKGAIAKCAESVGGMQACIDMTVAYAKDRVQYGKPIGAFQAIQHIIADAWIAMETSRYLVYKAAWMESEGLPCDKESSMAKAYVNEAYKYVSKWGVRLHGAIGTSRDHDMSLYYRRAKAADISFGNTDFHNERVAGKIGLV